MSISTKRKVGRPSKTKQLDLFLEPELIKEIIDQSENRGVTPNEFVGIAVKSISPIDDRLHLEDEMPFGKYKSFTVEQIVRCDLRYAQWMLENVTSYKFHPEVEELLWDLKDILR